MAREKRITRLGKPVNVTEDLKKLRNRAGLSMDEIAKKLGFARASSYQRYENATQFQKDYLPADLVERLSHVLTGLGNPPIDSLEILRLAGIAKIVTKAAPEGLLITALQQSPGPKLVPVINVTQVEQLMDKTLRLDTPFAYVSADDDIGDSAFCLQVVGNSMEPVFQSGDRIICVPSSKFTPGNYVVAKADKDQAAVIRRYRLVGKDAADNDIVSLIPENSDYPVITLDATNPGKIYARVIEHRKRM